MKISIITVNLNNCAGLKSTIESVLKQHTELEYIVIDGNSSDGSKSLLDYYSDNLTTWLSEPDTGIYQAMNKGIARATGDYCMFLNSGDELFADDTIAQCNKLLTQMPEIDILYGNIFLINSVIETQNFTVKKMPAEVDAIFFRRNTLNHQATLFRTNLFKEFGLYPEQYRLASDYWLYLISLFKNKLFYHFDETLVKYDLGGVSVTSFEKYQLEMNTIWTNILPKSILGISIQNDSLIEENQKITKIMQYKAVKLAVALNDWYQKIKFV